MERAVTVARTNLADDEKNVNRLRVPEFGILGFNLSIGGKASKTYLQPGAAPAPAGGADDFHFVPDKESITIGYEIDDSCAIVDEGTLELFTRFKKDPLWTLDLKKLGPSWLYHGKHEVTWDGRVVKADEAPGTVGGGKTTHDLRKLPAKELDDFPDGYVTLEHSPYKLKLTLKSELLPKKPVIAWTHFQIVLKGIELELGPEQAIPKAWFGGKQLKRDKAVRQQIDTDTGVPPKGPGAPRKVVLPSNLFKKKGEEMYDHTAYDVYEDLWGEGPNIPVFAKIRLADSTDAEVKLESDKGAVALGKTRFLWEWVDPGEAGANVGTPKAFIDLAKNYYAAGTDARSAAKDHTYPIGDNCHVDRGGKRGPDAKPVFTEQSGYKPEAALKVEEFPFKVKPCKKRKWSALSRGWGKGALAGKTGVIFQPSRMAGDNYILRVFLAWDHDNKGKYTLDVIDEPLKAAPAIQAETGTWQVWRELHIARYIRKDATINDFLAAHIGGIQSGYSPAFVDVVDKRGANGSYFVAQHQTSGGSPLDYNALTRKLIKDHGDVLLKKHYISDVAADHAAENSAFRIRNYSNFIRETHFIENGAAGGGDLNTLIANNAPQTADQTLASLPTMALAPPAASPQATIDYFARLQRTQNVLVGRSVDTDVKYSFVAKELLPWEDLLKKMELLSGGRGAEAGDGVTIIEFNQVHNVCRDLFAAGKPVERLQGVAVDVPDHTRNRCVFAFFEADVDTFNHEVGHHLFLPHSKWHDGNSSNPPGPLMDRHDDDDHQCTMSYSNPPTMFCGLCQLRLRGWSAKGLDKDDAKNQKT
jgi:hypothetical protein